MSASYRTIEGDVLDKVVYDHYGNLPGALERVLAHNPAIRHENATLEPEQIIILPDLSPEAPEPTVRLWT